MYRHSTGYRLIAYIIDTLIIGVGFIVYVVTWILNNDTVTNPSLINNINYQMEIIFYFIYFLGFAMFNKGRTIGKIICRLQIKGGTVPGISTQTIVLRELVKGLTSGFAVISFFVCAIRKDHKSIHDLLTDSICLRFEKKRYQHKGISFIDEETVVVNNEEMDDFDEYN